MNVARPDLCGFAGLHEDAIEPILHIDRLAFSVLSVLFAQAWQPAARCRGTSVHFEIY
jgi:hypothetical protein